MSLLNTFNSFRHDFLTSTYPEIESKVRHSVAANAMNKRDPQILLPELKVYLSDASNLEFEKREGLMLKAWVLFLIIYARRHELPSDLTIVSSKEDCLSWIDSVTLVLS